MNIQKEVMRIQRKLKKITSKDDGCEQAVDLLKELQTFDINTEVLAITRIGKTVNDLRKSSKDPEVITLSRKLIKNWKSVYDKFECAENSRYASTKTITSYAKKGKENKQICEETGRDGDIYLSKQFPCISETTESVRLICREKLAVKDGSLSTQFPPNFLSSDFVRQKYREMLASAIKTDSDPEDFQVYATAEELAEELEEAIFMEFKNTGKKYQNRVRSRIFNLKDARNPNLRTNFRIGVFSASRLAVMSAEEMASDELKQIRIQFMKESINNAQLAMVQGTKTHLFKCGKCIKRNCTYIQMQTRSHDEPTITFVLCDECGNRWKLC